MATLPRASTPEGELLCGSPVPLEVGRVYHGEINCFGWDDPAGTVHQVPFMVLREITREEYMRHTDGQTWPTDRYFYTYAVD